MPAGLLLSLLLLSAAPSPCAPDAAAPPEADAPEKTFRLETAVHVPEKATRENPCPLIVLFHGTGATAKRELENLQPLTAIADVAILSLQGPMKEKYGPGWTNDPACGRGIEAAIREFLTTHPEVDAKRIVWMGVSAGCYPCCRFGSSRTSTLCHGIVLVATCRTKLHPVREEGKPPPPRPRICAFLGTKDRNIEGLDKMRDHLKEGGAVHALNLVEGLGHAIPDAAYLKTAVQWVLEPDEPTQENRIPSVPDPALHGPKAGNRRFR